MRRSCTVSSSRVAGSQSQGLEVQTTVHRTSWPLPPAHRLTLSPPLAHSSSVCTPHGVTLLRQRMERTRRVFAASAVSSWHARPQSPSVQCLSSVRLQGTCSQTPLCWAHSMRTKALRSFLVLEAHYCGAKADAMAVAFEAHSCGAREDTRAGSPGARDSPAPALSFSNPSPPSSFSSFTSSFSSPSSSSSSPPSSFSSLTSSFSSPSSSSSPPSFFSSLTFSHASLEHSSCTCTEGANEASHALPSSPQPLQHSLSSMYTSADGTEEARGAEEAKEASHALSFSSQPSLSPSALLVPLLLLLAPVALPASATALDLAPEPANALSLPTWIIHVSSVAEWVTAMFLVWQYGGTEGRGAWRGLAWAMVPALLGAMCACTWHFFYNAPELDFLVVLQAFATLLGNFTLCFAAYRIFKDSQSRPT